MERESWDRQIAEVARGPGRQGQGAGRFSLVGNSRRRTVCKRLAIRAAAGGDRQTRGGKGQFHHFGRQAAKVNVETSLLTGSGGKPAFPNLSFSTLSC